MPKREKRNKSRGSSGNNRKSGEDFLIKNKAKPGVIETSSGLQYMVLEKGQGSPPHENSTVTIHQRCLLLSGKVLEVTYKENKPSEVNMSELIEGYKEGFMLMTKGSRYKFFIPPHLAWGKEDLVLKYLLIQH